MTYVSAGFLATLGVLAAAFLVALVLGLAGAIAVAVDKIKQQNEKLK